jgi:hypothetical protein
MFVLRTLDYVDDGTGNILRPVVEEKEVEVKTRHKLLQLVDDITDSEGVSCHGFFTMNHYGRCKPST